MSFIELTCPSCGANIQLNKNDEFCICEFCGARITQDKTIVEHTGKVSIDGISTEQTNLERAYLFIEDGNYAQASDYFEKTLDINPHCSKAYIGKLLCQFKCKSVQDLESIVKKPLTNYDNYKKAKRFASADELKELELIEKTVSKKLENINKKSSKNKIIKVFVFLFILLIIFLSIFFVFLKQKNSNNITTETVIETTESTTRPELKVSLGVTIATPVGKEMMRQSGISKWVDECRGIYVSKMTRDSLLNKTKFRPGDIIQAIDGKETNTLDDIYEILAQCNPGDTITVSVFRINLLNGEQESFEVEVTFPESDEEAETGGES